MGHIPENIRPGDIWMAKKRIAPYIVRTPLVYSPALSNETSSSIYLKLETLQPTGAFKVRGAANKIVSLTDEEKKRGVTTFSTGNHGMAVAYVAGRLGVRAVVCISRRVPQAKVALLKSYGAQIKVTGDSQDDAEKHCMQLEKEEGMTVVPPFDDPEIIAGQGTIALEILEDLPDVTTVVIPLSGGGLLSGVALALKEANPDIRIIGVSMERAAVMYQSLRAGRPVVLPEEETLADSLLGGIGMENRYTFQMVQRYMDDALLVSEEKIARAMALILQNQRIVVEGAAACALAACLEEDPPIAKKGKTVLLMSGNNVDFSVVWKIAQQYV